MAEELKITQSECSERYTKYLETHTERPKNQKIDFEVITEILSDFGVAITRQPSVMTAKV